MQTLSQEPVPDAATALCQVLGMEVDPTQYNKVHQRCHNLQQTPVSDIKTTDVIMFLLKTIIRDCHGGHI